MDQDLKQRLVGAVVITALAAIFVPMLFDDPIEPDERYQNLEIPALPPEMIEETIDEMVLNSGDVIQGFDSEVREEAVSRPSDITAPQRWFLQVGIFSQQENALGLRDRLRAKGYRASAVSVQNEGSEMFRVLVGPELVESKLQRVQRNIERDFDIKGILFRESE